MNLTDTDQTPIARVFEFVKREAARYGVCRLSSEIVGLIPKKALEDAAEWFLQVENFDSSLILENRLAAVMSGKWLWAESALESSHSSSNWLRPRRRRAAAARRQRRQRWRRVWAHGCRHVARQESLRAVRARVERCDGATGGSARGVQGAIDADAESFNEVMAAFKKAKESVDGTRLINPRCSKLPASH